MTDTSVFLLMVRRLVKFPHSLLSQGVVVNLGLHSAMSGQLASQALLHQGTPVVGSELSMKSGDS